MLFAGQLVGLFLSEPIAYSYGVVFSLITLSSGPFFGAMYVTLNAMQGIGRSLEPLLVSVGRQGFLLIPLIFLFQHWMGTNGLVWAQPVADVISTVMGIALYWKVFRDADKRI